MPVKLLPAVSLTDPDGKTTKYWVLADRSTVGSIVNEVPDRESLVLEAALKDSMMAPVAEPLRISMFPVPRAMFSEKVSVILLPATTPVAPSVGLKIDTLGAAESASVCSCNALRIPSENSNNSAPEMVSIPSESLPTKVSLTLKVAVVLSYVTVYRASGWLKTALSLDPSPPTKVSLPTPPISVSFPAPPASELSNWLPINRSSTSPPVAFSIVTP